MPTRDEILANADYIEDDASILEHAAQILDRRGALKLATQLRLRRDEWRAQAASMRERVDASR